MSLAVAPDKKLTVRNAERAGTPRNFHGSSRSEFSGGASYETHFNKNRKNRSPPGTFIGAHEVSLAMAPHTKLAENLKKEPL